MKNYLFALMLVSTSVSAIEPITTLAIQVVPSMVLYNGEPSIKDREPVTVVTTGVGKTCDQALTNAKNSAVEKAVGVWMNSEAHSDMNSYSEKITQYSGGLIESYNIISNECNKVTIEATVISRSNKITTNSANIPNKTVDLLQQKIANEQKRQLAIKEVNDRSKAIGFEISNIEFKYIDSKTYVVVEGDMFFQDKWKHDYYDLMQQTNKFNLSSFDKPVKVALVGYNSNKEILNTTYQLNYDGIELWWVERDGEVKIRPNKRDKIRLTFLVNSGIITSVDKLFVRVI